MGRYRIVAFAGMSVALCGLAGCGNEPKFVRVSGVIKINGVPYDKAVISFQPMGSKENLNPGRGSSSYTDAQGRFVLVCDVDREGAVVGKHRVRIMTRGNNVVGFDPTIGSPDQDPSFRSRNTDPIPPEWNALSTVEFTVPPGGTDQADFDIQTKSRLKR